MFRDSMNYCLGQLVVEAELGVAELIDGYQERGHYGEGSDDTVLGSRDEYQKAWYLSLQNLVQCRGKSPPACAGIMKDSAALI